MTIDEAKSMLIAKANCIDNQCKGIYEDCNESLCDNCVLCYAQGTNGEQIKLLRQCAEWLEELKVLRLQNHLGRDEALIAGRKEGYIKAIDDFVKLANEHEFKYGKKDISNSVIGFIDFFAEQLKSGELAERN